MRQDTNMRFNLIIMVIVWCSLSVSYYISSLMIKYVKGDIFVNVLVSVLAEIFSLVFAGGLSVKFGLKRSIISAFLISFIGALLLFVF